MYLFRQNLPITRKAEIAM